MKTTFSVGRISVSLSTYIIEGKDVNTDSPERKWVL